MIVVRPGETPCEKSTTLALIARTSVRHTITLMEAQDCSRVSALNLILQSTLVELGFIDVRGMERLATAIAANVAAALNGDRSGDTLDEVIAACEAIDLAFARKPS